MNYGVVYKFKPHNKINGTLFYCFEYFKFLRKYIDVKFYVVGINEKDLKLVTDILTTKYNTLVDNIIPITLTELYKIQLDRTLILDVNTFYDCKEFLSNEIHCFSNDTHEMFRYKNDRTVTYYGLYPYQRYDVECILKLNFELFPPLEQQGDSVFISALDQKYIRVHINRWKEQFDCPLIVKKSHSGVGNLFEHISAVHYVHTERDTNNRIIPEAFFYGKTVTLEEPYNLAPDSIRFRYDDIVANGLSNYTLTENCPMVQACLK